MTIRRQDIDAGRVDFKDMMKASRKVYLPHPGKILLQEWLEPLDISAYRLAHELAVPLSRISAILNGKRSISADTALRLARFFSTSPNLWLGLQQAYDLDQERRLSGRRIESSVHPLSREAA